MSNQHPSAPMVPGEESQFNKKQTSNYDYGFLKNDLYPEFSLYKGNSYVYKMYHLDDER
jgi:hypothetical protein